MAYLISVLAFCMAFGAIWFTAEAAKSADLRGKAAVKPHIAGLSETLRRVEDHARELERRLAAAERELKILKSDQPASGGTVTPAHILAGPSEAPTGPYRASGRYNA